MLPICVIIQLIRQNSMGHHPYYNTPDRISDPHTNVLGGIEGVVGT